MKLVYWEIPLKQEWVDGNVTVVTKKSRRAVLVMDAKLGLPADVLTAARRIVRMNNDWVRAYERLLQKKRLTLKARDAQKT